MSESGANGAVATSNAGDSPGVPAKQSAAKDKNCPYCGQAFTSSSLGRHLDLYVKDKNPKPPDGIHDVDAIRKMRSGITRRQPRGSLARRDSSAHIAGSPPSSAKKASPSLENAHTPSASDLAGATIPQAGQFAVDHPDFKYSLPWEATGVMLDIPPSGGGQTTGLGDDTSQTSNASRKPSHQLQQGQRAQPNRAAQKAQLDARQRLADATDTARAAELALREILSSWRAAKQDIDLYSLPFDFDPLSLDFPALTLHCLHAPPTLFSSIPYPTSTSWSIDPPSEKQHEALKAYFQQQFQKWRLACVTATTVAKEDFSYPPLQTLATQDVQENIKKAEKVTNELESKINEHLESTYQAWEHLSPERKRELWVIELARSVGRRQKEVCELKDRQRCIKQENSNLKSQIEHLNKLQQPREFRVIPPATISIEESIISYLFSNVTAEARRSIGFSLDDRHMDLNDVVSTAIERWKSVIVSQRVQGMAAQKPLDQSASLPTPTSATAPAQVAAVAAAQQRKAVPAQQQRQQPQTTTTTQNPQQQQQQQAQHPQQTSVPVDTAGPTADTRSVSVASAATATPVAEEENETNADSDEDADAEMDEDESFQPVNPVPVQQPMAQTQQQQQQQPKQQLNAARARVGSQQQMNAATNNNQFRMNGAAHAARANMAALQQQQQELQQQANMPHVYNNNFATVDADSGDPMYMD